MLCPKLAYLCHILRSHNTFLNLDHLWTQSMHTNLCNQMDFRNFNGKNPLTTFNLTSSMKAFYVKWSLVNGLIVTKNPHMAMGVMWNLLLVGFWSCVDLSWLATCFKYFVSKVLCLIATCFFKITMQVVLKYGIKPLRHLMCNAIIFKPHMWLWKSMHLWSSWHWYIWVGCCLLWKKIHIGKLQLWDF
jgi:hypothetical protein